MRKAISVLLCLIALASAFAFFRFAVVNPIRDSKRSDSGDFLAFYMAAYRLSRGEDIYDLRATRIQARSMGIHKGPPEITYPPFSIVPFVPLTYIFPPVQAFQFVVIFYAVLYWAALPLLFHAFRLPFTFDSLCIGIIVFSLYTPAWGTIDTGQINMVVLIFVSIGLVFIRRRKDGLAGTAFGLATVAKLFPGIAAIEFLIQRRYRSIVAMILVGISILAASLAIGGTKPYKRFISEELPHNMGVVHAGVHDISAKSFVHRVFVNGRIKGPHDYRLSLTHRYSRIAVFTFAAISLVILLLGAKQRRYIPLRICLLLTLMLIISPWTWTHHLVMALPCLAAVIAYALRERGGIRIWMTVSASVSYILMAIGYKFHIRVHPGDSMRELIQSSSLNLYGVIILFSMIAVIIIRLRKSGISSSE